MSLWHGEVALLSIMTDVHYFFSEPEPNPSNHRFEKTSYLYLYHDPMKHRGRLEIANNPGTPDQDAFTGCLDKVQVQYSYKHPNLFSITVDALNAEDDNTSSTTATEPHTEPDEWHLSPAHSINGTTRSQCSYKIHTLDLYIWTIDDSTLFLDSLGRVLSEIQLVVTESLPPIITSCHSRKPNSMSKVVDNLENAANVSQFYGDNEKGSDTSLTNLSTASRTVTIPPAQDSKADKGDQSPQKFAPIPYDPTAPAAPEPIVKREISPPPPNAESVQGEFQNQNQAASAGESHIAYPYYQDKQSYVSGTTVWQSGLTLPATNTPNTHTLHQQAMSTTIPSLTQCDVSQGSYAPPDSSFQQTTSLPLANSFSQVQQQAQYDVQMQQGVYYGSSGQPPGQGNILQSTTNVASGQQSMGMPGPGYSQYTYNSTFQNVPQQQQQMQSIHSHVYVPTEADKASSTHRDKLGSRKADRAAEKIEKGVGRLFKKMDRHL